MARKPPPGLFITGNDTDVGKTYVAALIARWLAAAGQRVGVYKPAASACRREADELVCDDAVKLWRAANSPGELHQVCPQRFAAPLAPHLAARAEGRELDAGLLREGLAYWQQRSDVILVEGAGGLMSPLGDEEYVADLAYEFEYPLVVVAHNKIGVISQTLQTLIAAATFRHGLEVAGIVLNQASAASDDPSLASNAQELAARAVSPLLAEVSFGSERFAPEVNWTALCK
jgi:dethiobiotin synthetase